MEELLFKLSSETVSDLDNFKYDYKIALGRDSLNSPVSGAIVCVCIKASLSNFYRQFIMLPGGKDIYTRYINYIGASVEQKGEWVRII